jgi:hypothetical protein
MVFLLRSIEQVKLYKAHVIKVDVVLATDLWSATPLLCSQGLTIELNLAESHTTSRRRLAPPSGSFHFRGHELGANAGIKPSPSALILL